MMHKNWHIITGGPSTGKTTLQQEMAKLGYATVEEAARLEIDDAVAKGIGVLELREDEKRFQDDVVRRRVKLEAQVPRGKVTFLDRGMQDSLAYFRYYNFPIEPWITKLIAQAKYGHVFLMEPLPVYKKDYARTEVLDFNDHITDLLYRAYVEHGMRPILVPPVSVPERVRIVLKHLEEKEK